MFLRSFKTRITLLFTVIFLLCSFVLFLTAYLVIQSSLDLQSRSLLHSRLLEFWAVYQTGSADLLKKELTLEGMYRDERFYMLRLAGRYNETQLLYAPPGWQDFNFRLLEETPVNNENDLITLRNPENGQELEVASLLLPDKNMLQIGISDTARSGTLARFRDAFLITLIPLLGLSVLGGLFFATRFLLPVRRLAGAAHDIITTGDVSLRIPAHDQRDELGELVLLFNRMLERIEKLVSGMRETLDAVAHDVRTPMTRLRAQAENALAGAADPAALKEALTACVEESEQVLSLLSALLEISRAEAQIISLKKTPTDLAGLLADILELYSYPALEKNIGLVPKIEGPLVAPVDVNRLRQALSNLLENALKYSPAGGSVELSAAADPSNILVTVRDSGRGIPPDEIGLIFDRFFRGREATAEPGFGLGLSLARAIVEAHGGTLTAASIVGQGSTFSISLPKE